MIRIAELMLGAMALAAAILPRPSVSQLPSAELLKDDALAIRRVVVSGGVELHYGEGGTGASVVFVHGSLSDGGYWNDQLGPFAASGYRAIACSRRYNPPNTNIAQPGYSAATEADDLAALFEKLQLGKVHFIGHSYGALTALFLAVKHPELVRTLVLAEPPAVSLLAHLPAEQSEVGKATLLDIQERMVKPMKTAFQKGDRAAGLRAFMDLVLDNPHASENVPETARQDMLNHAHEWDIMMTAGEFVSRLGPTSGPQDCRAGAAPLRGKILPLSRSD
jgi:pimeloyl-ACP methyl ester carboxylesterase